MRREAQSRVMQLAWIESARFRHNSINLKKNTAVTGNLTTTGTGIIDGNGSTGGITLADGQIDIRTGTGNVSKVKFYCESGNAHAQTLKQRRTRRHRQPS